MESGSATLANVVNIFHCRCSVNQDRADSIARLPRSSVPTCAIGSFEEPLGTELSVHDVKDSSLTKEPSAEDEGGGGELIFKLMLVGRADAPLEAGEELPGLCQLTTPHWSTGGCDLVRRPSSDGWDLSKLVTETGSGEDGGNCAPEWVGSEKSIVEGGVVGATNLPKVVTSTSWFWTCAEVLPGKTTTLPEDHALGKVI